MCWYLQYTSNQSIMDESLANLENVLLISIKECNWTMDIYFFLTFLSTLPLVIMSFDTFTCSKTRGCANEDKNNLKWQFCCHIIIITIKQAIPRITWGQHGAKSESPGSLPGSSPGTFALNNICRVWYPNCQFEDLISDRASRVYLMNSSFVPTRSASLMNGSLCLSLSACVCLLFLKSTASGSRAQRQDLSLSRVRVHLWMVSVVCLALFFYSQCLDFKSGNLAASISDNKFKKALRG